MEQVTASAEDRRSVARVLEALGPVAVVRMVPVATATPGEVRQRTEVLLFDGSGVTLHERIGEEGHLIARDTVRAALPLAPLDRAWDYHAATGVLVEVTALREPPEAPAVPVVPLSEALGTTAPTPSVPCSFPPCDTDGSGEPCDRHELEQAHAEGGHELCAPGCDAEGGVA